MNQRARATSYSSNVVRAELLGKGFSFATEMGVFSAGSVDAGTKLLLQHLPPGQPRRVLDLGCGYGALGLPIAAQYAGAQVLLTDRSVLATELAHANAHTHGIDNATVRPSLGYRDVASEGPFDWILCNVPARIGERAIEYFWGEGRRLLADEGEMRVVVIRDLDPVLEDIGGRRGWERRQDAQGASHSVWSFPGQRSMRSPNPLGPSAVEGSDRVDHESIYVLDAVEVGGLSLERPTDFSEDVGHFEDAIPLLLGVLPSRLAGAALTWRCGYGAVALTLAKRGANVTAADLDLIATTFTGCNAARSHLTVVTTEMGQLRASAFAKGKFALVVGDMSQEASDDRVRAAVAESVKLINEGGTTLWLGLSKQGQRVFKKGTQLGKSRALLGTRGAYSVWQVR